MPLPRALFLYGLLLGTGLTTFVPASAAWALPALSLALGSVTGSLAIALGFAAGRALPVLVLAVRGEETVLAERPHGLRVLRVLTAASLLLALVAGEVRAATTVASHGGDPSVAATDLAWQHPGVGGFLSRNGVVTPLPGSDPAIGGALIAWHLGPEVTVAARDTLAPVLQQSLPGVQKLAVSDRWLVWRAGREIRVLPLSDPTRSARVVEAKRVAELGRPALDGDLVVYHRASAAGSWLSAVDVATGKRRRLRFARDALLLNPSLLRASLLYVRASRCSQELRLGSLGGEKERVLYRLPPLAGQDRGHERNHTNQGERLPCPHRTRPTTRCSGQLRSRRRRRTSPCCARSAADGRRPRCSRSRARRSVLRQSTDGHHLARLQRSPPGWTARPRAARAVPDRRLPGALCGADAAHAARGVDVLDPGRRLAGQLDVGGVPGSAERDDHEGHPLRDEVVEARHELGGRLGRHPARRGRARGGVRCRVLRRRLHDEPAARRRDRGQSLGRIRLRR